MSKFNNFALRGRQRQTFNVPGVAGNYANERITFGAVGAGEIDQDFLAFTVLVEDAFVPGCTVELWLPRVSDSGEAAAARTDADYFNSRITPMTTAGAQTYLGNGGGWVGAQVRVKSGGTAGTLNVSATAV